MRDRVRPALLCVLIVTTADCSASKPRAPAPGGTNSAAGSGAGSSTLTSSGKAGSGGASGSDGTLGDFGSPQTTTVMTTGTMPGDPLSSACVGQTQGAQELTVDMYIMLDRSDSMLEVTGAGPTKWDAIRDALSSFIHDPQSSGLEVGLQYFPLGTAGIPEKCTVDSDCGSKGGQCTSRACLPPVFGNATFTQCLTDADCPINSRGCAYFGVCSGDDTAACFDLGAGGCQAQGDCNPFQGECTGYGSCTASDYAAPAVPIGLLPDNADALATSLDAEMPIGLTPTPAALSGALSLATQQANAHPDHRVIVVLATDGFPTQCLPSSVQTVTQAVAYTSQVAMRSFAATPSISTYVIGVFSPDDPNAAVNLNALAVAGGTQQAFIVDQSQDVTQQLLTALATIRAGSLACEYALPTAPAGQTLDFQLVNVEFTTSDNKTQDLLYVASPDKCDKAALGWYYDVDPSTGQTPTKINVCPKTCDTLRAATGASIQIKLGCATMGPS